MDRFANSWARLKYSVGGIFLLFIVYIALQFPVQVHLEYFLHYVQSLGEFWGPIVFVSVYIVVTVLFLPAVILSVGAGFIYGNVLGTILTQTGCLVGACISFLLGKVLFKDCVMSMMDGYPTFVAINKAVSVNSWKIVTLLRLSPLTPFNVLNYGLALTNIQFWDYTWSSAIGMLPQSVLFVYIGTAAKNLSDIIHGKKSPVNQTLFYAGLLLTLISTLLITYISTKAIQEELREMEQKKSKKVMDHV